MGKPEPDKKARARAWVHGYVAIGTATVIAAIIPGTTSAALIAMELHMCYQIGKIYRGDNYTMQEATAAARVVGLVAIGAQMVALEALDFVPFAGWAVKGAVAGGVIKTLGEAVIKHYEKLESQIPSGAYIELPPIATGSAALIAPPPLSPPLLLKEAPSVESRLAKLQSLLDKKIITPAEYEAKRQQVLNDI